MKLSVYNYDVWGNDEDGYDVNDVYHYGTFEQDVDLANDESVVNFLKDIGFAIDTATVEDFDFDGDAEWTVYLNESKNQYPFCEIRNESD